VEKTVYAGRLKYRTNYGIANDGDDDTVGPLNVSSVCLPKAILNMLASLPVVESIIINIVLGGKHFIRPV